VAMAKFDLAGISCSSGSACVSGSMEDSHVIKSLGKLNDAKHAPIRFSLSEKNTINELNFAIKIIEKLLVNSY
jgi:cysteine desulfurase